MSKTMRGEFETRRSAELAVEHIVQQCGVERGNVKIQPAGTANSAGTRPAGADAKADPEPEGNEKLEGRIEVIVTLNGAEEASVADAFRSAGAKTTRDT